MARSEPNFVLMEGEPEQSPVDLLRRRALRLLQAADQNSDDRGADSAGAGKTGFAAPAAMVAPQAAPARALAVGIVTMPAVFLGVVMFSLALFGAPAPTSEEQVAGEANAVDRLEQPASRAAISASTASARSGPSLILGEDQKIESLSLDGDRIAMHVNGVGGAQIIIYDYRSESIVSELAIKSAALQVGDELASLTGAPPTPSLSILSPAIGASGSATADEPAIKLKDDDRAVVRSTLAPPSIKPPVAE